jgi:dihydroneopterin aldolase / 2-amino-4-hydroxy-6-hydroxymethyldihydropteridine diphosphokinase
MAVICYLGVGSNLGDRRNNIKSAVRKINALKETKVIKLSRIIETEPVGGPRAQAKFLNAALKIRTAFSPAALLRNLKNIEKELGRKKAARWGPRSIDLDILFYGDRIVNTGGLKIPHPRISERRFVLEPLSEII